MKPDVREEVMTAVGETDLLSPLLRGRTTTARPAEPAAGPVLGRLLALAGAGGEPLVCFPGQLAEGAVSARSTVDLFPAHIGRDVLLVFESGDPGRPIVTGVLRGQLDLPEGQAPGLVEVCADGRRLTICAEKELVLRCGKATLTLRHDGRIELRGESIVSHASEANRILGGSVQLN